MPAIKQARAPRSRDHQSFKNELLRPEPRAGSNIIAGSFGEGASRRAERQGRTRATQRSRAPWIRYSRAAGCSGEGGRRRGSDGLRPSVNSWLLPTRVFAVALRAVPRGATSAAVSRGTTSAAVSRRAAAAPFGSDQSSARANTARTKTRMTERARKPRQANHDARVRKIYEAACDGTRRLRSRGGLSRCFARKVLWP